jgi:hypothetical protein
MLYGFDRGRLAVLSGSEGDILICGYDKKVYFFHHNRDGEPLTPGVIHAIDEHIQSVHEDGGYLYIIADNSLRVYSRQGEELQRVAHFGLAFILNGYAIAEDGMVLEISDVQDYTPVKGFEYCWASSSGKHYELVSEHGSVRMSDSTQLPSVGSSLLDLVDDVSPVCRSEKYVVYMQRNVQDLLYVRLSDELGAGYTGNIRIGFNVVQTAIINENKLFCRGAQGEEVTIELITLRREEIDTSFKNFDANDAAINDGWTNLHGQMLCWKGNRLLYKDSKESRYIKLYLPSIIKGCTFDGTKIAASHSRGFYIITVEDERLVLHREYRIDQDITNRHIIDHQGMSMLGNSDIVQNVWKGETHSDSRFISIHDIEPQQGIDLEAARRDAARSW